ncbi:MAG: DUF1987 domain-containing protein, partial [Bacteroidales bacterium]
MEELYFEKTFNTPEIRFVPDEGLLRIEGRSIPEDPGEIYDIIIEKLHEYFKNPSKLTRVEIKLEYINSGSSKYLLELLRIMKRNYDAGADCLVTWFYEEDDESILELGQHY